MSPLITALPWFLSALSLLAAAAALLISTRRRRGEIRDVFIHDGQVYLVRIRPLTSAREAKTAIKQMTEDV